MQFLNVSGFWKPSVKSNIFESFHQHSIGNRNIKVGSRLHLELVHCIPSLGNVDLVAALHFNSLLLTFFAVFLPQSYLYLFGWDYHCCFLEKVVITEMKKSKKLQSLPQAPIPHIMGCLKKSGCISNGMLLQCVQAE